jgi:uncharacterized membrane protein (UPF0182 family)
MKEFPNTVKPKSAMSQDLYEHLRYPQDLFKVQREMLTQYHVTSPTQFYSGSERWQIPDDPTTKSGNAVPPYYLSMKMPDQASQTFSLTTTFTPNRRDNLGAFMAVDADAKSKDYGRIRLLKLPSNSPVSGPKQVQSKFNSEADVADKINILRRGDSDVEYGNLLTVPLEGGLLYIEPVYVRGAGANYPLLKKVLVTYGEKTAFENTLPEALDVVFGVKEKTKPGQEEPEKPATPSGKSLAQAVKDADQAFKDGQKALEQSPPDWDAYGQAQKDLEDALKRVKQAEKAQTASGSGKGG